MSGKTHTDKALPNRFSGNVGQRQDFLEQKVGGCRLEGRVLRRPYRETAGTATGGRRVSGINGVAAWMGWPDSPTYAQREAEYLAEEIAVVDEYLAHWKRKRRRANGAGHHRQRDLRARTIC